jgi:hypothetical protein
MTIFRLMLLFFSTDERFPLAHGSFFRSYLAAMQVFNRRDTSASRKQRLRADPTHIRAPVKTFANPFILSILTN